LTALLPSLLPTLSLSLSAPLRLSLPPQLQNDRFENTPQQTGVGFSDYLHFDPTFYVADCTHSRGKAIDAIRHALVCAHTRLCKVTSEDVPSVCLDILCKIAQLRKDYKDEPIVTVGTLLSAVVGEYSAAAEKMIPQICRQVGSGGG
jgi:hypothetical protein